MKYVHIGYSRTGTTWLQKLVFPEWMKDNDVSFFNLMEQLNFHQQPHDKILLSGESIGAHPFLTDTIEDALENMMLLFGEVKVIVSYRDPQEIAESLCDSIKCSFGAVKGFHEIDGADVSLHKFKVYEWLDTMGIDYCGIEVRLFNRDCVRLAKFMDINPPTEEQVKRWMATKINKRFPKWLLVIIKTLYKWRWHRVRKVILLIRLILNKTK